jgi:hypothetical protein
MTFDSKRPIVASGQPGAAGVPSEDGRAGSRMRSAEGEWRATVRGSGGVDASSLRRGYTPGLFRAALPLWAVR